MNCTLHLRTFHMLYAMWPCMLTRQPECHADARLAAQQPGSRTSSAAEVLDQEEVEEEEEEDDLLPQAVIEAVKRSR